MVVEAALPGAVEAVAAGLADGLTPAAVLVVGSDHATVCSVIPRLHNQVVEVAGQCTAKLCVEPVEPAQGQRVFNRAVLTSGSAVLKRLSSQDVIATSAAVAASITARRHWPSL
jgi:hypothetical protein